MSKLTRAKKIEEVKEKLERAGEYIEHVLAPRAAKAVKGFVFNNKDLIIDTITEVAKDTTLSTNNQRKDAVLNTLRDAAPGVKFQTSWLNLIIETALSILKTQKVI